MSNLPLGDDLKSLFDEVTSGKRDDAPVRAILVHNENGILQLIDSLPEEGSDKEDFNNVLGKLFAKEPSKPGYALYRLDSKSPAGLYEWLNCAYRPEGAKVREKMQYSITQASLFRGLNEQHFLETVYGGTTAEFAFPSKLRNQRKHDYQNPQQSTAGKKAAEAAGTGTAGRRNFDKIPSPSALPQRPTENTRKEASPPSEPVKTSTTSGVTQHVATSAPTQADKQSEVTSTPNSAPAPAPKEVIPARVKEEDEVPSTKEDAPQGSNDQPISNTVDDQREADAVPETLTEPREQPSDAAQEAAPSAAAEEAVAEKEKQSVEEKEKEEVMQESIAPSSDPALTEARIQAEPETAPKSLPTPASNPTTGSGLATPTRSDSPIPKSSNGTTSAAATAGSATSATSSVGTGKGAQGLETEREKHLASLRGEEEKVKSSGNQGGSHIGFPWQSDVEPALNGLAKKLTGTSEWNLVILKIDLAKEEIQLSGQPRFVPPGDLAEALPSTEPCYAFYSHPDVQTQSEGGSSRVTVIYVCPSNSSVRQRMLYSANLALTCNRVGDIEGVEILKRIETSDPQEITADFLTEELLGESSAETGQAKALSRPKRPGRR